MTTRRALESTVLALAIALVGSADAAATSVARLDDAALRAGADVIAVVTVTAVRSVELTIAPGVFTDVDVVVEDDLRGWSMTGTTLTLRIPGGQAGDHRVIVEGMPEFTTGERVVIFAEAISAWDDAFYLPVGLNQGVWRADGAGRYAPTAQDGLFGDAEPLVARSLAELRAAVVGAP